MVDPTAATPAGGSVIHDLGYRPYHGPRLGPGAIARALVVTGFRNTFGLGRSGKSKVLPFVLLTLNLLPAVIVGGIVAFAGADELPIGYAEYASQTQVLLGIFVAAQAPVLFSRDLRHGTIALYLARPLRSDTYAWRAGPRCSRPPWSSSSPAPHPVCRGAARSAGCRRADPRPRRRGGLRCFSACASPGVAGLVASWSVRRGFAVVATIACCSSPTASSRASRRSRRRRAGHDRRGRRAVLAVLPLPGPDGLVERRHDADPADRYGDGADLRRGARRPLRRLCRRALWRYRRVATS